MTYGWAILIIAVVLGALFQLGVFNPSTFAPKARAGSCQVIRPYGIGNTNYISLAGTCNNQLPQYVLTPTSGTVRHIFTASLPLMNSFTLAGWVYPLNNPVHGYSIINLAGACGIYGFGNYWVFDTCNCQYVSGGAYVGCTSLAMVSGLKILNWQFVALTVDTSGLATMYAFQDGAMHTATVNVQLNAEGIYVPSVYADIGDWGGSTNYPLNGRLSNIQVYNTSLSQNDITALYQEGIGGAPIDLFHLVGWWPLNGNANDYSGNQYDGTPTNVIYTGSWATTYTPP